MGFLYQPAHPRSLKVAVVVSVCLLVSSCAESKVSQCKKLIDVANQVVADVQTVAQNASTTTAAPPAGTDSVAVITRVAEAAEQAKSEMESLNLSDESLEGFQSRYATMYTEISRTTRDMLAAAEAKDREAGKNAYDAFKTATSQEGTLVDEINAYCAQ